MHAVKASCHTRAVLRVVPRALLRALPRLISLCFVLLVGCASSVRLTPSLQQTFGTRTFAAPYQATFEAAGAALPRFGYTLSLSDPAAGRIVTGRRPAGVRVELGLWSRETILLYRQYELRVLRVDAGHTQVSAVPHMYAGKRDITSDREWTLDGPEGEREKWKALFAEIDRCIAGARGGLAQTQSP